MRQAYRVWAACVLLMSVGFYPQGLAAAKGAASPPPMPVTTAAPKIAVDQLDLLLLPLTKEELVVEADGWLALLHDKVEELSAANIALKQVNKEMAADEALSEAEETLKAAEKTLEEARAKNDAQAVEKAEAARKGAQQDVEKARKAAARPAALTPRAKAARERALEAARKKAAEEAAAKPEEKAPAGEPEKPATAAVKEADKTREAKSAILDYIVRLRSDRNGLIDRLESVLAALTAKGGEAKQYEDYIVAVSGISMDVSDTSAVWATITGWLTSEDGGVRLAVNLLRFLVVLAAFVLLAAILGRLTERAMKASRRVSTLLRDFAIKSVRRTVLVIGLIVSLSALGVNIGPLLALIGAAGFVIGFALQGTLSNFASGILILLYRPFDVGDVVDVAGVSGKVSSLDLISTHLMTFDNKRLVVPNNEVWGGIVTNATGAPSRRVDMTFGIGYADDIAKAQSILEDIVNNHELVLKDPEPVIKLHELADSSVNFICRPWTRTPDYWTVYWDVTRAVKETFDKNGISIPFPQRDVHLYQEGTPA